MSAKFRPWCGAWMLVFQRPGIDGRAGTAGTINCLPSIKLKVTCQANAGPSAARNTAAVLDADPMAVSASGWMATFGVMQSVVRPTRSAALSQFPSNGSI